MLKYSFENRKANPINSSVVQFW